MAMLNDQRVISICSWWLIPLIANCYNPVPPPLNFWNSVWQTHQPQAGTRGNTMLTALLSYATTRKKKKTHHLIVIRVFFLVTLVISCYIILYVFCLWLLLCFFFYLSFFSWIILIAMIIYDQYRCHNILYSSSSSSSSFSFSSSSSYSSSSSSSSSFFFFLFFFFIFFFRFFFSFLLFFFSLLSFYYYSSHSNYYSWSSWSIIYATNVAECKLVACALSSISYAPPPLANRRANLPFFDTTRETQNEACLQKQECDRIMSVGLPQTFRKVQQSVARGEHAWSS